MDDSRKSDGAWLSSQVKGITESVSVLSPSEFAKKHRVIPASVTARPGPMHFDDTPYIVEILDCFDVENDVREVTMLKAVQTAGTVGVLESVILYFACEIPYAPVQFISATTDLVKVRMESNILPMFHHSGLDGHIQSNDKLNPRKTGLKSARMDFAGGGMLLLTGSQSGAALRSHSIKVSLRDEVDTFKSTSKEGDIDKTMDGRQSAYWSTRKTLRITTPLEEATSIGWKHWLDGDRRRYFVACRGCSELNHMRWNSVNDDGVVGGVVYSRGTDGLVDVDSVRYCCPSCGHAHSEYDKSWMLSPENGAGWRPTSTPVSQGLRSYHVPGMLSPTITWSKMAEDHAQAFFPDMRVRDLAAMKTFYNLGLGYPWKEKHTGKLSVRETSSLRRNGLFLGKVNNSWHLKHCGANVSMLVMTVDVHKDNLAVAVFASTLGGMLTVVDYWRLEPKDDDFRCHDRASGVWEELSKLIESKEYIADDGRSYRIMATFIDAGYANSTVVGFCGEYASGVYFILGRDSGPHKRTATEFNETSSKSGVPGFIIFVDIFKATIDSTFRREYNVSTGQAPQGTISLPEDMSDSQLKELTREVFKKTVDRSGVEKYRWDRIGGSKAPNELWDLMVYAMAGVAIVARQMMIIERQNEVVDWDEFYRLVDDLSD